MNAASPSPRVRRFAMTRLLGKYSPKAWRTALFPRIFSFSPHFRRIFTSRGNDARQRKPLRGGISALRGARSGLPPTLQCLMLTAVFGSVSLGCAAYRLGSYTMYPGNIRTVHVPVFRSESIRPDLSEWLTEAVVKEIELKTNYKVVARDRADTILEGEIVRDQKSVLVESSADQPRSLDLTMLAHVRWTNRHGQLVRPEANIPLPDTLTIVEESSLLVPEVGQSLASSQQQVIHRLAEQIVAMMEVPW